MSLTFRRVCEHVIEGGWLIALVAAPLFFNIYSSRVFEPDKASIIRTVALVMLGAWLARLLDSWLRSEAGPRPAAGQRLAALLRTPLLLPATLLVAAYVLSTAFSLAPALSLWGSYERGQGLYTTLSYVVVFASVLALLRQRQQLERLIYAAVLTGIPVAIYGLLQHHDLDPLPWLGDVTVRVAGSQGNAIFLGAYLIMAFFLTLYLGLDALTRHVRPSGHLGVWLLFIAEVAAMSLAAWALNVWYGMAALVLAWLGAIVLARLTRTSRRGGGILALCTWALSLQLLCIYYTGSRGPWLGFLAGLYLFGFLGLIMLRARAVHVPGMPAWGRRALAWLWSLPVVLALLFVIFLATLNAPGSPLAPLRQLPGIGRLGSIMSLEEGTNKVRALIWEGSIQMIAPHAPLQYPDGRQDRWNPIRPLVGYGPEAMWVAYNRFYPPDLAHYEARNASPDRSHNETLDALAMTGILGFLAYMALFLSAFYYAFRWLNLIAGPRSQLGFLLAAILGAVVGVLAVWLADHSLRLAGVGLPAGLSAGMILFATWSALRTPSTARPEEQGRDLLLVLALLSAIMAHFIEIHFGIAIVATRLYFWTALALLAATGMGRIQSAQPAEEAAVIPSPEPTAGRVPRKRKAHRSPRAESATPPAPRARPPLLERWLPTALIVAAVLMTLAYDFTYNSAHLANPFAIFWHSLASASFGILLLWLATWFAGLLILLGQGGSRGVGSTAGELALFSAAAVGIGVLYGLWHSSYLRPTDHIPPAFTAYILALLSLILLLAFALAYQPGRQGAQSAPSPRSAWSLPLMPIIAVAVWIATLNTNISPVQADTFYKQGLGNEAVNWDNSIALYRQALTYRPTEDRYYLFLGRAALEKAKATQNADERERVLQEALDALLRAQAISPLNTDHTANLARLYRSWADYTSDESLRRERLETASDYYRQATVLSPHNAQLFNEWGIVYTLLGQPDEALARFKQSLALDPLFPETYLLVGNLHLNRGEFAEALAAFDQALALDPGLLQAYSARGYIYSQTGRLTEAISDNLKVLELSPDDFATWKNLAILYNLDNQPAKALEAAEQALARAPEEEKGALQAMIAQLRGALGMPQERAPTWQELAQRGAELFNAQRWDEAAQVYEQVLALNPDAIDAHAALGYIAFQRGDLKTAEQHNLRIIELAPNDYNAHKNLALVYQAMGELEKALAQAEIALTLVPEAERAALTSFVEMLRSQVNNPQ